MPLLFGRRPVAPRSEGRRAEDHKSTETKVDELYKWHLDARDKLSKLDERTNWVLRLTVASFVAGGVKTIFGIDIGQIAKAAAQALGG